MTAVTPRAATPGTARRAPDAPLETLAIRLRYCEAHLSGAERELEEALKSGDKAAVNRMRVTVARLRERRQWIARRLKPAQSETEDSGRRAA